MSTKKSKNKYLFKSVSTLSPAFPVKINVSKDVKK